MNWIIFLNGNKPEIKHIVYAAGLCTKFVLVTYWTAVSITRGHLICTTYVLSTYTRYIAVFILFYCIVFPMFSILLFCGMKITLLPGVSICTRKAQVVGTVKISLKWNLRSRNSDLRFSPRVICIQEAKENSHQRDSVMPSTGTLFSWKRRGDSTIHIENYQGFDGPVCRTATVTVS